MRRWGAFYSNYISMQFFANFKEVRKKIEKAILISTFQSYFLFTIFTIFIFASFAQFSNANAEKLFSPWKDGRLCSHFLEH